MDRLCIATLSKRTPDMNHLFNFRPTWRCSRAVLSLVLAFLIAGCGQGRSNAPSQVAARVNKGEISVHQVQYALQRQPRAIREQPEQAARKILTTLVEEELAAQAARAEGLDHDPDVLQALLLAQREVLARAYQDRLASKTRGSTSDEIDSYYDGHPALFEQRRLYLIQETAVEATRAQSKEVEALARSALGAEEIVDRLRAKSFRFETRQFVQAAESLPLALLFPMAQLSKGQSIVVSQPDDVRIFTVLHFQVAPVGRRLAAEPIATYLDAERRRRIVADGMKDLRKAASIEYFGSFAEAAASAPTLTQ